MSAWGRLPSCRALLKRGGRASRRRILDGEGMQAPACPAPVLEERGAVRGIRSGGGCIPEDGLRL